MYSFCNSAPSTGCVSFITSWRYFAQDINILRSRVWFPSKIILKITGNMLGVINIGANWLFSTKPPSEHSYCSTSRGRGGYWGWRMRGWELLQKSCPEVEPSRSWSFTITGRNRGRFCGSCQFKLRNNTRGWACISDIVVTWSCQLGKREYCLDSVS